MKNGRLSARMASSEENAELGEDQQPVAAELLERGIGLSVREKALPKKRAGNELHDAFALEQIEDDHHRKGGGKPKRRWG